MWWQRAELLHKQKKREDVGLVITLLPTASRPSQPPTPLPSLQIHKCRSGPPTPVQGNLWDWKGEVSPNYFFQAPVPMVLANKSFPEWDVPVHKSSSCLKIPWLKFLETDSLNRHSWATWLSYESRAFHQEEDPGWEVCGGWGPQVSQKHCFGTSAPKTGASLSPQGATDCWQVQARSTHNCDCFYN